MTKLRAPRILCLGLSLLTGVGIGWAQAPPATDIFLVSLDTSAGGVEVGTPVRITDWQGYDNQPYFLPDGRRLAYTSIDGDGQADIWIYDLEEKTRSRFTKTTESEYSPTPIPGDDAISVVRVEADSRQRLWRFPLAGGDPELLLPNVEPVGYHAWSEAQLALFVLGEPPRLEHATPGEGTGQVLASNIGRALHRVPGSAAVSFVHKEGEGGWTIKEVDLESAKMRPLTATRPGREDFSWSPDGDLWMGDASQLYVWNPARGEGWRHVADFAGDGIAEVTRITVHPEGRLLAFAASFSE